MYKRTFTSGSKQVSQGNDVITFSYNVQFLHFQTFDKPCSVKLNDEDTIHWIDANSDFKVSDIYIGKFTIIDAGVNYYYTALSID